MDDFDWLEEEKQHKKPKKTFKRPQVSFKKPKWLEEYGIHLFATILIFGVLFFLIFNPASKSVAPQPGSVAENERIVIRMPDKTTKIANTAAAPIEAAPVQKMIPAAPTLAPAEEIQEQAEGIRSNTQPSPLLNKQLGVISSNDSTEKPTITLTPAPTIKSSSQNTEKAISEPTLAPAEPSLSAPSELTIAPPTEIKTPSTPKQESTIKPAVITPPASKPSATIPQPSAPITTPPAVSQEDAHLHTLLKRSPSDYTLQLFGSNNKEAAKKFISENQLASKAVYAKVWQNNQDWYIVLYGDYTGHSQAVAAIKQLPGTLQAQSPWARSMQSVQDAIRQRLVRGK
jgi:septal ring-binding cell division protein DamX